MINHSERSTTRQLLASGRTVRKIVESSEENLQLFPKVTNFFINQRNMSKEVFKLSVLTQARSNKLMYKQLLKFYKQPFVPAIITSITPLRQPINMVDISVEHENFIANGIITHNSAHRYERLREGAALDFYKRLAEHVKEEFFGNKNLKGILLGGPGPTKYDFMEHIRADLRNKIIAVRDLSYTSEFGLQELLDKCQDVLAQEDIASEKKILGKFFEFLSTKPGMVSYGEAEVKQVLEMGAVDVLLLSEELEEKKIEKFEKLAKQFSTRVEIISTETREGAQLRDFGKIAAILRYEVNQ
jgi:hypothetical protein